MDFSTLSPSYILGVALPMYAALLFSLSVHEASHALAANLRGDPSARLLGRMTLNPIPHIDPIGTLLLPLMMLILSLPFLFGWAKPVPFNPRNLKDVQRDPVFIALAGPASNLVILAGAAFLLRLVVLTQGPSALNNPLMDVFVFLALINTVLMVFNLVPIPPLDGSKVLAFFLPENAQRAFQTMGPMLFILLIMVGFRFVRIPIAYVLGLVEYFIGAPVFTF